VTYITGTVTVSHASHKHSSNDSHQLPFQSNASVKELVVMESRPSMHEHSAMTFLFSCHHLAVTVLRTDNSLFTKLCDTGGVQLTEEQNAVFIVSFCCQNSRAL